MAKSSTWADASKKALAGLTKLSWGIRTVGVLATVRGAIRLLVLKASRPQVANASLRSGVKLQFDYPSQLVPALVVFGDLIDPEFDFLRRIAKPSWTYIDVGAAIGQFSIFAAKLPCASVHAFEPSEPNLKSLRLNLERNEVDDLVTVHRMALSNRPGRSAFSTAPNAYLSRLDQDAGITNGQPVDVRTLTQVCEDLNVTHASVLKINVAGFEPEVIEGAEEFLSKAGADILILLLGLASLPWYTRLTELGYRFFFFHPGNVELHEADPADPEYLATRPWPARHAIAIHREAIEGGILGSVRIH